MTNRRRPLRILSSCLAIIRLGGKVGTVDNTFFDKDDLNSREPFCLEHRPWQPFPCGSSKGGTNTSSFRRIYSFLYHVPLWLCATENETTASALVSVGGNLCVSGNLLLEVLEYSLARWTAKVKALGRHYVGREFEQRAQSTTATKATFLYYTIGADYPE